MSFNHHKFEFYRILHLCLLTGFAAVSQAAKADEVFLGPTNAGAENGSASWYGNTKGKASLSIGDDDAHKGIYCFVISNSIPDRTNCADWRSRTFYLQYARDARQPVTLSLAYKLPNAVKEGDEIPVRLRFFDKTGGSFLGENIVYVGSSSGDSEMPQYKTIITTNVPVPKQATVADIWITANIFEPWSSGNAEFDDFSVTTASNPWERFKVVIIIGIMIFVIGSVTVVFYMRAIRNRQITV